jgi:hypothetical protein
MIVLQIAIQCLVCVITDSRCASAVLGLGDPGGLVACLFFYNFSLVVGLFFFSMGTGLRGCVLFSLWIVVSSVFVVLVCFCFLVLIFRGHN